ncbi:MAG: hypothetical protein QXG84_03035 [Ignisphaera sp.]
MANSNFKYLQHDRELLLGLGILGISVWILVSLVIHGIVAVR